MPSRKPSPTSCRTAKGFTWKSRWATGEPIPVWLAEYLRVMQELDRLHRLYVKPPKPVKEAASPVDTSAPRTETRAEAMARTLAETNFGKGEV